LVEATFVSSRQKETLFVRSRFIET